MLKWHSTGSNGHIYFRSYRSLNVVIDLCPGLSSYIMAPEPEYLLTKLSLILFCWAGARGRTAHSALLFTLAIEPLAETIRSHPDIRGYNTEYTKNNISLYADDILLYVTQPRITIPSILKMFNLFGSFSGYKINWGKSELLPVQGVVQNWLKELPLRIASDSITYLGIVITKKYNDLYKANFPTLLNKLTSNIQFWRTLPISLLGRVNAIEMIFLPQLLYLFQNLPIYLAKSFFSKLDSIILPVRMELQVSQN